MSSWSMLSKIKCNLKSDALDCSELSQQETKGEAIEKVLHKYEMEIRAHIKMENEFKMIAEETEQRYEQLHGKYID